MDSAPAYGVLKWPPGKECRVREGQKTFAIYGGIAALKIALTLYSARGFGLFIDELYLLACADHLAFGYVDNPPFATFMICITRAVAGDGLVALRVPCAIAGAVAIALVGRTTKRLGGGLWAQTIAMLVLLLSTFWLLYGGQACVHAYEHLAWSLEAYLLVRLLQEERPRWWLWIGVVAGLGLQDRVTFLIFGAALVVGLALTRERRWFRTGHLWAGGAIALLILVPNLLWQAAHGFPSLEYSQSVRTNDFAVNALVWIHPLYTPLWIAGLIYAFRAQALARYRLLPVVFAAAYLLFLVLGGKAYYLAPAYVCIAPALGLMLARLSHRWWSAGLVGGYLVLAGLAFLIVAVPLIPLEYYVPSEGKFKKPNHIYFTPVPDTLQGRTGWEDFAAFVASNYHALNAADRAECALVVETYGEAAALHVFGPARQLPEVYSPHNSFYYWGPPPQTSMYLFYYGEYAEADLRTHFDSVRVLDTFEHPYPYTLMGGGLRKLYLCKGPKFSWQEWWPTLRRFH